MACELQISIRTNQYGNFVTIKDYPNSGYGLKEQPNDDFVYIRITDGSVSDVQNIIKNVYGEKDLTQAYESLIEYETLLTLPAIDGFRINMYTGNANASGLGDMTRERAEGYLNKWNAVVQSGTKNSVIFDIWAFDNAGAPGMLQSEAFWSANVDNVIFTEDSYNATTGLHKLTVDYSNTVADPDHAERIVTDAGGIITEHVENEYLRFDMEGALLGARFRQQTSRKLQEILDKKQFYLTPSAVNTIRANGGILSATLSQFETYINNRIYD